MKKFNIEKFNQGADNSLSHSHHATEENCIGHRLVIERVLAGSREEFTIDFPLGSRSSVEVWR